MLDRLIQPYVSGFKDIHLPAFKETILPNGIKLMTLDSGDESVSRLSVLWPAGLIDVDAPAPYALMCNLMTEGCGSLSGKEVTDVLEYNGAWLKISPTQHSTLLTLHSLNHTADEVFALVGNIIAAPSFPINPLESIKKKSAAEKELATRKPSYQATLLARQTLFGERHPLARAITPEDILAVERATVVKLHRSVLLSNKPTVFLSGKITPELETITGNMLCAIPFDESNPGRITRRLTPPPTFSSREVRHKEMPDSMQTGVRIQIPAIPREHPDYEALRFAVTALGGYFGSRLMTNIREDKGYTYGISANLIPSLEGSNIVISCECDNRYTNAVVNEIWREINRMADEKMSLEETDTVRNIIISSLAGILDSPFSISSFMEQSVSFGLTPENYARQFTEASTITPERIAEISARYMYGTPSVTALAGGKPG